VLGELADAREELLTVLTGMMGRQLLPLEALFDLATETHSHLIKEAEERSSQDVSTFLLCVARSLWGCTRLAVSKFELILCGLGEEAKLLNRLQIEGVEMLHWLLVNPQRAEDALAGRCPKAGIRAKDAGSPYWEARDHLNKSKAHFSLKDMLSGRDAAKDASIAYLKYELLSTFADLSAALAPAISSMALAGLSNHRIADQAEDLLEIGFKSFGIHAIASFGVPKELPRDQQANYRYRSAWPEIARFP